MQNLRAMKGRGGRVSAGCSVLGGKSPGGERMKGGGEGWKPTKDLKTPYTQRGAADFRLGLGRSKIQKISDFGRQGKGSGLFFPKLCEGFPFSGLMVGAQAF